MTRNPAKRSIWPTCPDCGMPVAVMGAKSFPSRMTAEAFKAFDWYCMALCSKQVHVGSEK